MAQAWTGRGRLAAFGGLLCACTTKQPRVPFTAETLQAAEVPGFENMRIFIDAPAREVMAARAMFVPQTGTQRASYLALSSGGEGGAYGAGYLNGWTRRGDRPAFDVVTGVSAGALIAPFAFVGGSVDDDLAAFFQDGLATQLDKRNSLLQGLVGESLYPAGPLVALIESQISDRLIDQVAVRYSSGARLLVLTTNIDAGRGVIWNLGGIAASDHADRYDLFRTVVRASASIPAIFPPTEIISQNGTSELAELHVDGAATRQSLFLPIAAFDEGIAQHLLPQNPPRLFMIVNEPLSPDFRMTDDRSLAIGRRAYSLLIRASTLETLFADYELAKSLGVRVAMTSIPNIASERSNEPFDPAYMSEAFELGMNNGENGHWSTRPDAFDQKG